MSMSTIDIDNIPAQHTRHFFGGMPAVHMCKAALNLVMQNGSNAVQDGQHAL